MILVNHISMHLTEPCHRYVAELGTRNTKNIRDGVFKAPIRTVNEETVSCLSKEIGERPAHVNGDVPAVRRIEIAFQRFAVLPCVRE